MESRAVHLAYEIMAHSGVACPTSATRSSLRLSMSTTTCNLLQKPSIMRSYQRFVTC